MAKYRLLSFILCLLYTNLNAQDKLGLVFNPESKQNTIHGYSDPISQRPNVNIEKNMRGYIPGRYYDKNGNVVRTVINFYHPSNSFSAYVKKEVYKDLNEENSNSIVIGLDSFFIAQNIRIKDRKEFKKSYVQYITEFDDMTFAKMYVGTEAYELFLVKKTSHLAWEVLNPDKKNGLQVFKKYFSNYPPILKAISGLSYIKSEFRGDEYKIVKQRKEQEQKIQAIIEYAKAIHYKNHDLKKYYDKYVNETKSINTAKYYSKIYTTNNTYFTEQIFNLKDELVYEINWDSKVYKKIYHDFKFYIDSKLAFYKHFINGELRSGKVYSGDSLFYTFSVKYNNHKNRSGFYTDSNHAQMKDLKNERDKKEALVTKFFFHNRSSNDTLYQFTDPISGQLKKAHISNNEIIKLYTIENDVEVQNIINKTIRLKQENISTAFNEFLKVNYYAFVDFEKPIYVRIKVNERGVIENYKPLNSVDHKFDKWLMLFFDKYLLQNKRFNKVKIKNPEVSDKKPYEFVLSFGRELPKKAWRMNSGNNQMIHQDVFFHQMKTPPSLPFN
ncbi:hypothetical protein [Flammeovirga sp. OC4]|uniref:hypothetical protein n=1 Tax=Flammeovirga sp. OC4 TaxID=1382345 RepID=UPI0005C73217|nr:hypothetical protein [Flammeovirga sp. OC4]